MKSGLRLRAFALLCAGLLPVEVAVAEPASSATETAAKPEGSGAPQAARLHFQRAAELVEEGLFDAAITEFRRAYEIAPHYSILYNIGQAYVGLGRPVEAAEALSAYLKEGGGEISAERQREVAAELELQGSRIATLVLDVSPQGAAIRVDGKDVGLAPLAVPLLLAVGNHVVSVSFPEHASREVSVSLAGRDVQTLALRLEPLRDESVVARSTKQRDPAARSSSEQATAETHATSQSVQPLLAYSLGAAGLGLGIAAGVVYFVRSERFNTWENRQQDLDANGADASELAPQQAANNELARSLDTLDAVTLGLAVPASALLLAGGIVLWTAEDSGSAQRPSLRADADLRSIRLTGAF